MDWLKQYNVVRYSMGDSEIYYSPIGRSYVLAQSGQFEQFMNHGEYKEIFTPLADYVPIAAQRKVKAPKDYTLLTVLPNNICNFSCSYCYSARGRNGAQLSVKDLEVAIKYFFESKPLGFTRPLTISFMGGGEPMLSWEVVREGIEYAKKLSQDRGLHLNIRIITNGSVLDEKQLVFIQQEDIAVSVSFELIPEIQNLQRKHYDEVYGNICRLLSYGIPVQVNATITPSNVERMTEMVEILHAHFPAIHNAMFEPVVGESLFPSPMAMKSFYTRYVGQFMAARKLADLYEIDLTSFAYLRTVFPLERACPGEFCITANGDITGCYCVATKNEPLFVYTKYGTVKQDSVEFDFTQYKRLLDWNVYAREECKDCPVKWNCGGGCFHQYQSYGKPYRDEVCLFTQQFVEEVVRYKVRRFIHRQYGDHVPQLPVLLKEEL